MTEPTEELVPDNVEGLKYPSRPEVVVTTSMAELFAQFEAIFLGGPIQSCCGHEILVFDHHFFHLASVTVSGVERLFMKQEKEKIQALTEGYGLYEVELPRA